MNNDILNTDLTLDSAEDMARQARLGQQRTKEDYAGFNPIYLNRFQRRIYQNGPRWCGVRAGRGTGKTTILGIHQVQCAQTIPRGTGLFVTPSLKSCYTKLQPALVKSMEQVYGLTEGVQFCRERPNAKWHWPSPLAKPRTWDNSLVFYTGHITYFTSIQSKATGNGLNLTDLTIDETRYVSEHWDKLESEIFPSLRGEMYDNPGWSEANYLYKSVMAMSDAAVTPRQMQWELKFREMITHEENDKLAEMLAEMEQFPELALFPKYIDKVSRQKYRCKNLFEFNTAYNLEVLGEGYLRELKLTLPPEIFAVQIMSQPLDAASASEAYYYCFNPDIHCYQPNEWHEQCAICNKSTKKGSVKPGIGIPLREWEAPDLTETALHADDDLYDVDIDDKYPLCLSWDLNANFNAVVISQRIPHGNRTEIRIINCLYTKYQEKLRSLLAKFNAYYAHRKTKNRHLVIIVDDTMKQGASYALEDIDTRYINVIQAVLQNAGWELEIQQLGRPMLHEEKFQLLNDMFAGLNYYDIRINRELDFLILALTRAKVIQSQRGPVKDKSKEKLKSESEDSMGQALETRTDVTDAFDQAIIGARKGDLGIAPTGTRGVHFILPTIM